MTIIGALFSFALASQGQTVAPIQVMGDDFESGSLDLWRSSARTIQIVSDPGTRNQVFRAVTDISNPEPYRSELVWRDADQGRLYAGKNYCIRLRLKVPEWKNTPNWALFMQTHAIPGDFNWSRCKTGRNSIGLRTAGNGMMHVKVIKTPLHMPEGGVSGDDAYVHPLTPNVWHRYKIHYRPSTGTDGILRIWKDGVLVYRQFGGNMDLSDKCGVPHYPATLFKFGIYKERTNTTSHEAYFDNVRVTEQDTCY